MTASGEGGKSRDAQGSELLHYIKNNWAEPTGSPRERSAADTIRTAGTEI
jgi:hypothetical protein